MANERRRFGQITKLPSGRYRARYADPDGRRNENGEPLRHNAPHTFDARVDAEAWLTDERRLITAGVWSSPAERAAERRAKLPTLSEYAPRWMAARKVKGKPLADLTRDHYQHLLDRYILPTFGELPLKAITPEQVAKWYDTAAAGKPTTQGHMYSLLRAILATAADPTANNGRALIPFNPCGIRGGGSTSPAKKIRPATATEIATIVAAMPERLQLMVLLADGTALRYGELAELRRGDVDTKNAVLRVRRGVIRSKSAGVVAKAPKSAAGVRDVPIPPHLLPAVRTHLLEHAEPGKDGLLFPAKNGGHMAPSAFYGKPAIVAKDGAVRRKGHGWYEARRVAGREDLTFHGLRHGALTEAAKHGATLAELMALAGHSTTQAAQRYQHAASGRLAELARKRSEAAGWTGE
ncbi:site-specific integrase [Nocardioides gansuensis]|uniref:Site-specific integrase n=1 Tax=Nocardioides gansuensis TaxID=2138300 RepID=A0A2T8FD41_9ACTN|nr:site-specific integrase [Nocardioides gansuensis]PVG83624.1 site-specific integrase [Nocardioides gansuensis]